MEEAGFGESRGGRRRSLLRLRAQRGHIVAISLERVGMRGMLTDLDRQQTIKQTVTTSSLSHPVDITLPAPVNLIRPEAVLIGGRICLAGDLVLDGLRQAVAQRAMSGDAREVPIIPGELQAEAPLVGAFCLVLRELFTNPEVSVGAPSFGPLPLHTS